MGTSTSSLMGSQRSSGQSEDGFVTVGYPVSDDSQRGSEQPPIDQPMREISNFTWTPQVAEQEHKCLLGDSLEKLSLKYGTTVAALKKRNKLVSSTLFPGRTVIVPAPSESVADESKESSERWAKARSMVPPDEDMFDTSQMWDGATGFVSLRQDYGSVHKAPSAGEGKNCTWVGGVFHPPGDCFVTKFSLHLKLVQGEVLRFRLILAEWVDDVKRGVGRPGGVLHCSSTMELKRGMEGANANGYVCFELDVPEEGGLGGVKKGMSVILAASTEGLTCGAEAEAHVGCVHKLVVGAVLHKMVWLNGRVGDKESDDDVEFQSAEHTLAGCVQMMSVARMLRGGLSIPTSRRTTQTLLITDAGKLVPETPPKASVLEGLTEESQAVSASEEASSHHPSPTCELEEQTPSSSRPISPAPPPFEDATAWTSELLDDLPMFLWRDDDGILRGVSSDVIGCGPRDLLRIHAALPPRCGMRDWELLYSTRRSGLSINTFFRQVTGRQDTIMVCRDAMGHTFGMFQGFPWKSQRDFYGRGESFVFTVRPEFQKYPWTRTNSMFSLTNTSGLLFGGGFKAAIWLDEDFNHGASGYCPTWGNPMLSGSESFICVHMEVWGMWQDQADEGWKINDRERLWGEMKRGHGWTDDGAPAASDPS